MTAPHPSFTWTDHVTGRQGFLVVDRLVRGVCSGGLRMRARLADAFAVEVDGIGLDELVGATGSPSRC